MTLIARVVLAFRPRESVTVAVNVMLPADANVPVVSAPFVAVHPPPVIVYEVMLLPYAGCSGKRQLCFAHAFYV